MTIPRTPVSAGLVERIAIAISEMEGFNKPGSRAQRQNNPGNLRSWGKTPVLDGFANFPTPAEGWRALRRQVWRNVDRGLTLYEFFGGKRVTDTLTVTHPDGTVEEVEKKTTVVYAGYAPDADGNRSRHYAEFVAKRAGIPVDVPLPESFARREAAAREAGA